MILSYKPIRSTGFHPRWRCAARAPKTNMRKMGNRRALFHFRCDKLNFPRRSTVYLSRVKYPFNLQYEAQSPRGPPPSLDFVFSLCTKDGLIIWYETCIPKGWMQQKPYLAIGRSLLPSHINTAVHCFVSYDTKESHVYTGVKQQRHHRAFNSGMPRTGRPP